MKNKVFNKMLSAALTAAVTFSSFTAAIIPVTAAEDASDCQKINLTTATAKMWSQESVTKTGGQTYSYTTKKVENTRDSETNGKIENLYDGDVSTSYKPGQQHAHVIDLGEDIPVVKLVVKTPKDGIMIYGLAKASEMTGEGMTNGSGASLATITSNNWFRSQTSLGTKLVDSNYRCSYTEEEDYYEFTLAVTDTGEVQSYRYIIFDDNNNSSTSCYELELYTTGGGDTPEPDTSVPEGALNVFDLVNNNVDANGNPGQRAITFNSNGDKKTVASSNADNHIYYLGDFDISEIEKIDAKISFKERTDDGAAQVKFAYMDIAENDVIDSSYLTDNSATIRSANKRIGLIAGTTTYMVDETDKAEDYAGAVYTISADGVTVDSEAYAAFPGGTATVDAASEALTQVKGTKHLFMYATASKGRAVMDYVKIYNKTYNKIDLTNAEIFRLGKEDGCEHTVVNGESVTTTGIWTKTSLPKSNEAYMMINGTVEDETSEAIAHTNNGNSYAYFIDLGNEISINKIILKNISASAIVTAVGSSENHPNGYVTDTGFTFNNEWARVNNSDIKNLTNVTAEYGEEWTAPNNTKGYKEVVLSGDFGNCQYIAFDGNNSASYIGEIEIYSTGEAEEPEPTEPELIIGDIDQTDAGKTIVNISVENPTAETEQGVLIAALYDAEGRCIQVELVSETGVAEFEKAATGYVKAFLWNSLSGENSMIPILPSKEKTI